MAIIPQINDVKALQARIQELEAQAAKRQTISFKVSPKGALSVYGLGRFPVTLYRGQWERLIQALPALATFVNANADKLVVKGADPAKAA